jgi:diacylglycerol kinase
MTELKPQGKSQISLAQAFKCAYSGIWSTIKTERNIKIELVFAALAIIAGFILQLGAVEWAIIVILIGIVLAAELFNSAIEALVDLASPEAHPLAKHAKDAAAGAVLILAKIAVVAGLIIFINAAFRLLGNS